MLVGKRILFIGPKFHGYEVLIESKLKALGAEVDFYSERSYSLDFKFINNFFSAYLEKYQERHYKKILSRLSSEQYDYLFVIRGFMMPKSFVEKFKLLNPNSTTIMYQWDSNRTNPFSSIIDTFDQVSTFDFKDSQELTVKYVPLFYTDDVLQYRLLSNQEFEYDFFFMGFFFKERYEAVQKFRDFCSQNNYRLRAFLYMPISTRIKYLLTGRSIDKSIVSTTPMDRSTYLKTLSNSRVMVDVSNPRQTGLAMRVIEALACNIKIATNNKHFQKDESVAKSGMAIHFDINNIMISEDFIKRSMNQEDGVVVNSIENWLIAIFKVNEV